jgi:hypothetical protein
MLGKTSAAMILARELGYEPILTNASDARNKASLDVCWLAIASSECISHVFILILLHFY